MAKRICDGCGKPIREGQGSLTMNTASTSEHWHLRCCPWLLQDQAPASQENGGHPACGDDPVTSTSVH